MTLLQCYASLLDSLHTHVGTTNSLILEYLVTMCDVAKGYMPCGPAQLIVSLALPTSTTNNSI